MYTYASLLILNLESSHVPATILALALPNHCARAALPLTIGVKFRGAQAANASGAAAAAAVAAKEAAAKKAEAGEEEAEQAAHSGSESDSDCEVVPGEEEALPEVSTKHVKVNGYESAVRVCLALTKLQRELHSEWDDAQMPERRKHGKDAQELGMGWGKQLRGHVNNKFSYFYLHLSMYHLEEIIIANGHPLAGDDSILEKGNHNLGKFKRMVFHTKGNEEEWVRKTRKRVRGSEDDSDSDDESQYEEVSTTVRAMPREAQQVLRLQRLKEHVDRMNPPPQKQQKSRRVQESLKVKSEAKRKSRSAVVDELQSEATRLRMS